MPAKCIQFVTYPEVSLLDLAGPLDVFIAANHFAQADHAPYSLSILSLDPTTEIFPSFSFSAEVLGIDTPAPHTLIVPGGPGIHNFCEHPDFFRNFVGHCEKASRLVSVCTGVFALATAGRLDGRNVTTHWSAYDRLEIEFPSIKVKRGPIFINDGDIWTSAGVTSGIDLALAIIEADLGYATALEVARHLVVFLKRSGDQNQFSSTLTLQSKSSNFSDLHAWINTNISGDLSVSSLANFMNMSERTFARKYREDSGFTPSKMVEKIRLEAVCHMLLTSRTPLKTIARKCGLSNEATLIRSFMKTYAVTPGEYRERFRSGEEAQE
ncbi:GlxA family transcriptional regulator [Pseudomonas sp. CFBP 13727]|jgi:transcriptional regulator GlxA family with amidase domain|uniref:GlxA family transcriptional regulator n=1 Tax=Pseudomonas sp. CFBP 13727 TaxID=2775295 RepID=UPI0017805DBB|nr:helix-turn-helix domain-containing protein [Pseudomonas sp. CFBP 13727]MBD8623407.1 helix-turn-helix domain-containing protein [Pseudomonas sp. CFBP 13727]